QVGKEREVRWTIVTQNRPGRRRLDEVDARGVSCGYLAAHRRSHGAGALPGRGHLSQKPPRSQLSERTTRSRAYVIAVAGSGAATRAAGARAAGPDTRRRAQELRRRAERDRMHPELIPQRHRRVRRLRALDLVAKQWNGLALARRRAGRTLAGGKACHLRGGLHLATHHRDLLALEELSEVL